MSRIAERLTSAAEKEVMCGGSFPEADAERLNNAWRPAGYRSRGDFVRDAVMDAVEAVEKARGGAAALALVEQQRLKKAAEKAAEKDKAAAPAPAAKGKEKAASA